MTNNERQNCASLFGFRDFLALTDFVVRHLKLRELDSNQHDDVQSVASCRWMIPHGIANRDTIVAVQVRGGGVEPPLSGSKPDGLPLADPRSSSLQERPAGVEPALPPRQGGRLPLHHGRATSVSDCQRSRALGGG